MIWLILLLSVFLHVWSDFYKQGWLAQAKCVNWWLQQNECTYIEDMCKPCKLLPLYKNDYWGMLLAHSAHWTFCIMLPILIYGVCKTNNIEFFGFIACFVFIVNSVIHSIIDNLKANLMRINLLQDQTFHLIQIMLTIIIMKGIV